MKDPLTANIAETNRKVRRVFSNFCGLLRVLCGLSLRSSRLKAFLTCLKLHASAIAHVRAGECHDLFC